MQHNGIIYKITNKINGKSYIGQTICPLRKRMLEHCNARQCPAVDGAIKKYGIENFTIESICSSLSREFMNDLESHMILVFNSHKPYGYNLTSGGQGTRNYVKSLESCLRISTKLGSRRFNCKSNKSYVSKTGRTSIKRKQVEGLNMLTGHKVTFESTRSADGFNAAKISECCNGKRKIHKNHVWRFI